VEGADHGDGVGEARREFEHLDSDLAAFRRESMADQVKLLAALPGKINFPDRSGRPVADQYVQL
jgi:hypothetical protein